MRQDMSFAVVRYGRLCFVSGEKRVRRPGREPCLLGNEDPGRAP